MGILSISLYLSLSAIVDRTSVVQRRVNVVGTQHES